MNNPENSNPAVLGSMLESYGDSSEFYVASIQGSQELRGITSTSAYVLSEGYTYQDINNAWNSDKTVLIYLSDNEIAIKPVKDNDDSSFGFYYNSLTFKITPENTVITEEMSVDN